MKTYPSIKRYRADRHHGFEGFTFAKHDGSNLRFEWEKKRGWFRFGSRRRLLDESHEEFGSAMEMFLEGFAEPFERLAVEHGWQSVIVFCEIWGARSFAGQHEPNDVKVLTPIDLAVYKKGLLSPLEFVQFCEGKFDVGYLGYRTWNESFVEAVQNSTMPGMAFEGVVGKNGSGHKRMAIKLKSQAWIKKVLSKYGEIEGRKLINS